MQSKKRQSIEKGDVSFLSQIMRKEIESLYKINKVGISELFFNFFISINLKLQNSSAPYLKQLLETTNQFLRVNQIMVISKHEEELSSYLINIKNSSTNKEKTKDLRFLRNFDELFEKSFTEETVFAKSIDYEIFAEQFDEKLMSSEQRVFPIAGKLKFIQSDNTKLLGLFFLEEPQTNVSGDEIWDM